MVFVHLQPSNALDREVFTVIHVNLSAFHMHVKCT